MDAPGPVDFPARSRVDGLQGGALAGRRIPGDKPRRDLYDAGPPMFFRVIACEIALREICHLAAQTNHLLDLDFLTQGHHENPAAGRVDIQQRIDALPAGKYDAILLGYGLCSNILTGLTASHTPLVIPRAHDCITFFLGSKERYQDLFDSHPGTYYYTSGWLECPRRRGKELGDAAQSFLPASNSAELQATYEKWVAKYGEEEAKFLMEEMGRWTDHYSHGTLIDFEFTRSLNLAAQVKQVCAGRGWEYEEVRGDLSLLRRWLAGDWEDQAFLVVQPGETIVPTHDGLIIGAQPAF